MITIKFL